MGKPIIWSGSNAKLINSGDFIDSKNNSLTNASKINVTKNSHGWTSSDLGRPLYLNGSVWTLAQANTSAAAEIAGFIYAIIDVDTVRVALGGQIPTVGANLLEGGGNLVAGEAYFLSPTTAGKITATEPTTIGHISKPIGVATSTTSIVLYNFRGSVVGGANARTQITLSNNTTADVLDVAAYDAGEIVGWVYIDATTDYRFLIKAQFAKNGAGTNWNISYQTVGDTPPASFSLSITSAGKIQYTMPNVTGYVTALLNYALNAPAVGTTYPLSINTSAILVNGSAFAPIGYTSGSSTITLTSSSSTLQRIASPSGAVTVTLPTTNILAGYQFRLVVTGATETNYVALQSSGANEIDRIAGGGFIEVVALQNAPTTAAHWLVVNVSELFLKTITFNGGLGTGATYASTNARLSRKDNCLNFMFSSTVSKTTGSASLTNSITSPNGSIPARFVPNNNTGGYAVGEIQENATNLASLIGVKDSNGSLVIYKITETNFSASVNYLAIASPIGIAFSK